MAAASPVIQLGLLHILDEVAETTSSIPCVASRTPAYQGEPGLCINPGPLEGCPMDGTGRSPGNDLQEESNLDRCVQHGVRETGQFSSKGIIYDIIGNLDRITLLWLITESASDSLNEPSRMTSTLHWI